MRELKNIDTECGVWANHECKKVIITGADHMCSTAAFLKFAVKSDAKHFIVATESGIMHEMQKQAPEKLFSPAPPNDSTCDCNDCNFIKLNTIEKAYKTLLNEEPEILIDSELQAKAVKPILRMLEISKKLGL